MDINTMVSEIRSELGGDVISLAIKDETIKINIGKSLRKIGAYSPKVMTASFPVVGEQVVMPEGTIAVQSVLSTRDASDARRGGDDYDIFDQQKVLTNYGGDIDPMTQLMRRNEIESLGNFIEVTDWYYLKDSRTLYFNYYNRPAATIKYLKKYTDVSEITDDDVLDYIQQYAIALCKIAEGSIRRKLEQAPGAIPMDGEQLVQEGKEEQQNLEEKIPKALSNLVFGIRA